MRYYFAAAASVVLVLLAMAAVPYADPWLPVGFAIAVAIGLTWAIAIRWRVVSGALAGLLFCALTPPLGPPNIPLIVMCIVAGAIAGGLWDTAARS
jgi:hypothetical protein